MNLRGLLEKMMYHDTVRIYRAEAKNSLIDDFERKKIGEAPCRLHQYHHQKEDVRTDRAQILSTDLRLCCDPEVDIKEGDYLEVSHEGEFFRLIASEPFVYDTHQEISCRRRREVYQR